MQLTSSQLRSRYLDFFRDRGHVAIPPSSLVPANDPSVLFTTAGMHPLVPYLLGEPHPSGNRLTNVQKCVRTGDIDVVGDATHLTFFEMLGNWSLGDYGREEAIGWSFEFLTDALGLPLERLGVTCFEGDSEVAADEESVACWSRLGVPPRRIARLGRDDNWWGPAGKVGPCGPDTEIFYWTGSEPAPDVIDVRDRRWVELWNNVFMSHTKTSAGTFELLPRANVDTGMGLERTLAALNGFSSVYEVDTVKPLYDVLGSRVLTDHVRAAAFIIADGVGPSNKDRGYVLRRLLRRSAILAQKQGLPADWYKRAIAVLPAMMGDDYPELAQDGLADSIATELGKFERALAQGLRVLEKRPVLDGKVAFDLLQTHGFPFELTRELAERAGKPIDEEGFRAALEEHRDRSRDAAGATFEGGLADHSIEIVRYHTLTHLLQAALREVLGPHVIQRGSNITRDRLRFDFSHDGKIEPEQLARIASLVNEWITRGVGVTRATMTEAEARALGAIGAFGEKYGETVSVYTVSDEPTGIVRSREFCGGPHITSSKDLVGRFEIVREQAIASGIRRIKAVLTA